MLPEEAMPEDITGPEPETLDMAAIMSFASSKDTMLSVVGRAAAPELRETAGECKEDTGTAE
jgi:hypothetical protein